MPYRRNPHYQPRPGEIEKLADYLTTQPKERVNSGDSKLLVISGSGGIGKTGLAVELAYRLREKSYFPDGIFWVSGLGTSLAEWQAALAKYDEVADFPLVQEPTLDSKLPQLSRYMQTRPGALLILDNVENQDLLLQFLPQLLGEEFKATILVTTRDSRKQPEFIQHEVEKLTEDLALRVLLNSSRAALLQQALSGSKEKEAEIARILCKAARYLPLILVQLRTRLECDPQLTLLALASQVQKLFIKLLPVFQPSTNARLFAFMYSTIWLNWELLASAKAQELLVLAAYYPESSPIPVWLLGLAGGLGESFEEGSLLSKTCNELSKRGLVELLADNQLLIHPFIKKVGRKLERAETHYPTEEVTSNRLIRERAGERLLAEIESLKRLEERALRNGYHNCLTQVIMAIDFAGYLEAKEVKQRLNQVRHWLAEEQELLADSGLWPERLPALFYQQLYNRGVESGAPFALVASAHPVQRLWLKQLRMIGREETEPPEVIPDHKNWVRNLAFSPDGSRILSGSFDNTACLWEFNSGKLLAIYKGHTSKVTGLAFSPDGNRVLTGSFDGTARLWETTSGHLLATFCGHSSGVSAVAFSPDGHKILTGSYDNAACLWEVATTQLIATFKGHSNWISAVAFSPDGQKILTGSYDNTACLWEVATKNLLTYYIGHISGVSCVGFSPDGNSVLTGSYDNTARLWETATGNTLFTFSNHNSWIRSVAFSPDGTNLLTGSADKSVRLWETNSGRLLVLFEGYNSVVACVAFSTDGLKILTGFDDNTALQRETSTGRLVHAFKGQRKWVNGVAFSTDGRHILTGSTDMVARLWEASSGKFLTSYEGHSDNVTCVAISTDSKYIFTGSTDTTARLWEVGSHRLRAILREHSGEIISLAFSPDSRLGLTGSSDYNACLWELDTGKLLSVFRGHSGSVNAVAFSPDSTRILTGSSDKSARLWDTSSGKQLVTFETHNTEVNCVTFSPDGAYILTGSSDAVVCLWDVPSKLSQFMLSQHIGAKAKPILEFTGHRFGITLVEFSPDRQFAVSADSSGELRFWHLGTSNKGELAALYQANHPIEAIQWLNQTQLVLADNGGTRLRPYLYYLQVIPDTHWK